MLNTRVLLVHAGAFGLYLLSEMVYYIAIILNVIFWQSRSGSFFESFYKFSCLFMIYTNFLSQCLIIVIFWDLGKKKKQAPRPQPTEVEEVPRTESYQTVVVEEIDEEFEMQAQIWTNFIRKSHLGDAGSFLWRSSFQDGWETLPEKQTSTTYHSAMNASTKVRLVGIDSSI